MFIDNWLKEIKKNKDIEMRYIWDGNIIADLTKLVGLGSQQVATFGKIFKW